MRGCSRGFTLIEMLCVTAIIVVLAAMLFPVHETVVKRAERVSCVSNMHNLAMAANLYADDYDDRYPPAREGYPPNLTGTAWDVLLYPYYNNELLVVCPSDQAPAFATGHVCYNHSYGANWDVTLVNGVTGASLTRDGVPCPFDTVLFFEIKGTIRAIGADYDIHGLSRVDNRHNGGANYAFCDGTARWLRPDQTVTPIDRWHP
jgi:prepilin-type N-terminal cleavage/methylation domain-containing protein/prepilin-type processing-associated H-X9-DG protein